MAKAGLSFFMPMNYYLYILQSEIKETYYVGSSDEPKRRNRYHHSESKGYTQRNRPWDLVFTVGFETKEEVIEAEKKVKSWKSKKMISLMVDGEIDLRNY